jgi:hypothetical protein
VTTKQNRMSNKASALRWGAVIIGLVAAHLFFSLLPAGDMDLFPTGMLWLAGGSAAWGGVMFGMFFNYRDGGPGPLWVGMVGSIFILVMARAEHGATPNYLVVLAFVLVLVAPAVFRRLARLLLGRSTS